MSSLLDTLAENDPRLTLLDDYLTRLQSGTAPPRARLLAQHPELTELVACLDALERLALPTDPDDQATLPHDHNAEVASSVSMQINAGRRFGNYELLEEIGRGGMGVVYRARQLGLNRTVAVKMILASQLATPDQVSRFQREARATATVQHGHVVRIFDVGEVEGQHYFAMEYIAGPTLAQLLRQGLPDATEAARLMVSLARAVAHLHEYGIVHRDLKPGNVLMSTANGVAKSDTELAGYTPRITDFGLARLREEGTQTSTGAVLGTPSYMPPEQASGRGDRVGPHSDIYSLGAILYEMLTGRPPFQGGAALNTILQVLETDPEPPHTLRPGVPRDLELICLKCLEKEPERRYTSATALADDLERFLDGEPVSARPDSLWQRCQRWVRQEPIMAARIMAFLGCVLVLQLNFLVGQRVDSAYHWNTLSLLAAWLGGSLAAWYWMREGQGGSLARCLWLGVDVAGLTLALMHIGADVGPLVIAYGLIVAVSGLWFRVHLVWLTTLLCELGYGTLILYGWWTRDVVEGRHRAAVFAVLLLLIGAVVAWQVRRVRFLSQRWLEP